MDALKRFQKVFDEYLYLRSAPVAIKLLEREDEVPPSMGRPLKDLGTPVRPCVGWHLARHKKLPVALLLEDFATACPSGMFAFGQMEPPQAWLNGDLSYGIYAASREAAMNMEKHVYRLDAGKYKGVMFAPLNKADFVPDIVMVFCNSKDSRSLIIASAWESGEPLIPSIAARNLCSEAVIQPFLSGKPVLAIPCGGDRQHGATHDDELVFATPVSKLEEITRGLTESHKAHHVERLGEVNQLEQRYQQMAKTLDSRLSRGNS